MQVLSVRHLGGLQTTTISAWIQPSENISHFDFELALIHAVFINCKIVNVPFATYMFAQT